MRTRLCLSVSVGHSSRMPGYCRLSNASVGSESSCVGRRWLPTRLQTSLCSPCSPNRPLAGPADREAPHRLGVGYGAGLLAAHVRAAGAEDGPACLDRVPRRGVRVLRGRPGSACARQPEDGGRQARPLRSRGQPLLCRAGGSLRLSGRLGQGAEAPRQGPVERPMPYVRDSFWRGGEFTSLEQMQAEAARWSLEVAGWWPCRPPVSHPAAQSSSACCPTISRLSTTQTVRIIGITCPELH